MSFTNDMIPPIVFFFSALAGIWCWKRRIPKRIEDGEKK